MNENRPDYSHFNLQEPADFDRLASIIRTQKDFTMHEYVQLYRQIEQAGVSPEVRDERLGLLRRLIYPLIPGVLLPGTSDFRLFLESVSESVIDPPASPLDPKLDFRVPHAASEFTVDSGVISIGGYVLRSKRIDYISPKWLKQIPDTFFIERDPLQPGHFFFVPITDFSRFLNEPAAVNVLQEIKETNAYKGGYYWTTDNCESVHSVLFLQQLTGDTFNFASWEENNIPLFSVIDLMHVPLSQVEVFDGYVTFASASVELIGEGEMCPPFERFWQAAPYRHIEGYSTKSEALTYQKANLFAYYQPQAEFYLQQLKQSATLRVYTGLSANAFRSFFRPFTHFRFGVNSEQQPVWSPKGTYDFPPMPIGTRLIYGYSGDYQRLEKLKKNDYDEQTHFLYCRANRYHWLLGEPFEFAASVVSQARQWIEASVEQTGKCFWDGFAHRYLEDVVSGTPQPSSCFLMEVTAYYLDRHARSLGYTYPLSEGHRIFYFINSQCTERFGRPFLVYLIYSEAAHTLTVHSLGLPDEPVTFFLDPRQTDFHLSFYFLFRFFYSGIIEEVEDLLKKPMLDLPGVVGYDYRSMSPEDRKQNHPPFASDKEVTEC